MVNNQSRNINQALLIIQNLIGAGNIASKRISIVSPFTLFLHFFIVEWKRKTLNK